MVSARMVAFAFLLMTQVEQLVFAKRFRDTLPASAIVTDWSTGRSSWQGARHETTSDEANLWDDQNVCDPRAVVGSAPLTVLFGISSFWENIKQHRGAKKETGVLEVHIIGAAYPFEGRSDWSLLAARRPADVPGVRVVLVLGTPWQDDNLPELKQSSLLQISSKEGHQPIGGHWSESQNKIVCNDKSGMKKLDAGFTKSSICRDHGNGLEVVCMEKLYQDAHLPIPDVAVMFSPGFPQLARRSWDSVLQDMLDNNVTIMVSDEAFGPSLGSMFTMKGSEIAELGGELRPKMHPGESGMTFRAMHAYKARRLGAQRNPFPLLLESDGEKLAKCAVLQVFQGREEGVKRDKLLPASAIASDTKAVKDFDWSKFEDTGVAKDLRSSLLTPVTRAYEEACKGMYFSQVRERVRKKGPKFFNSEERGYLERLGLVLTDGEHTEEDGHRSPVERWGPKAWLFFLEKLNAQSFT